MITASMSCALGLAIWASFEVVYAFVNARWDIPSDKDAWLISTWVIVIAVLTCSGTMPLTPSGLRQWAPLFVVLLLQIYINSSGGSYSRRSGSPPDSPPTSIPPAPPASPGGREKQDETKPIIQ